MGEETEVFRDQDSELLLGGSPGSGGEHLACCPVLGDHFPLLPDVHCLENFFFFFFNVNYLDFVVFSDEG